MKVFCVRVKGYKTVIEFWSKESFDDFVDSVADKLENFWVEIKEVKK